MYAYIVFLTTLISINIQAAELAHFNDYKESLPLLNQHINLLDSEKGSGISYTKGRELQAEMLVLRDSHKKLTFGASPKGLQKKAADMEWKNVVRKAGELNLVCEGQSVQFEECLADIQKFKQFCAASNLNESDKKILDYFFDRYTEKIQARSFFNEEYVAQFDAAVNEYNSFTTNAVTPPQPQMVVKVSPVAIPAVVNEVVSDQTRVDYSLYTIGAVLILASAFGLSYVVKKKRETSAQKKFVAQLFKQARKHNMHLRVFGQIDSRVVKASSKIEAQLGDFFHKTKVISKEVQLKYKVQNHLVFIEAQYTAINSLQAEIEKEISVLKESFDVLASAVEAQGGEIHLSSKFNNRGNVTETGFAIQLQA